MISTKGRYAIRLLMDIAEQPEGTPVPLDDAALRQGISKKYLEVVAKLLVKGGMIKGTSGKGGGYRLLRKPEEYTIWEILENTEESMAVVACLDKNAEECPRKEGCKTIKLWSDYDALVRNYFSGVTLADLLSGNL